MLPLCGSLQFQLIAQSSVPLHCHSYTFDYLDLPTPPLTSLQPPALPLPYARPTAIAPQATCRSAAVNMLIFKFLIANLLHPASAPAQATSGKRSRRRRRRRACLRFGQCCQKLFAKTLSSES